MRKQKIIRTGNSLAVTVPASFVKMVGVKEGQEVIVKSEPEKGLIQYRFSGLNQLLLSGAFGRRKKK